MVLKYWANTRQRTAVNMDRLGSLALNGCLPSVFSIEKTPVVVKPHHHKPFMKENVIEQFFKQRRE